MKKLTRRTLLQSSLAAPGVAAVAAAATGIEEDQAQSAPAAQPAPDGGRERLLLDFGWRFHFGNASDAAQDFNFRGNFSKTGGFGPAATPEFDDSDWKARGPAARLGRRTAVSERPGAGQQGLLSPGAGVSGHQRRMVPARVRTPGIGGWEAHLHRIRRRLPRSHGRAQRLLPGPAYRRIRSVPFRRRPISRRRAGATCCWCASTRRRATAGSTKARAFTGTCGW